MLIKANILSFNWYGLEFTSHGHALVQHIYFGPHATRCFYALIGLIYLPVFPFLSLDTAKAPVIGTEREGAAVGERFADRWGGLRLRFRLYKYGCSPAGALSPIASR